MPGDDGKRFVMANDRPKNRGSRAESEPFKLVTEVPSKRRVKTKVENEALRPALKALSIAG